MDLMQYLPEQGSSASQMTAAKVMDIISRLPGCAGQEQRTQYLLLPRSKWEDAPKLLKVPKSECPDIWIRLPRHKKGYSYLCMWMTPNVAGKKQNINPMWKVLNKEVDLGENQHLS